MRKLILISGLFVIILGIWLFTTSQRNPIPSSPGQNLEFFLKQNNASKEVADAYQFALENPQNILSQVKCYCGCLKGDHKNNRDCFINEDGSFDLMGLNCGLCVKTALTSKQMMSEGKTIGEISKFVDDRWGKEI